jgi:hypothetical protein
MKTMPIVCNHFPNERFDLVPKDIVCGAQECCKLRWIHCWSINRFGNPMGLNLATTFLQELLSCLCMDESWEVFLKIRKNLLLKCCHDRLTRLGGVHHCSRSTLLIKESTLSIFNETRCWVNFSFLRHHGKTTSVVPETKVEKSLMY